MSASFGNLAIGPWPPAGSRRRHSPDQRQPVFLYNAATGALSFDSNGNGAGGVSQAATLTAPKNLLFSDIQVAAA